MATLFGVLLFSTSLFLILLVLVQRGRGGGLTGALGGMGGQSAFGSKAGDVFTKITVWTTFVWILLCVAAVKMLGTVDDNLDTSLGGDQASTETSTILPGGTAPGGVSPDGASPDGASPGTSSTPTDTSSAPAGEANPIAPPSGDDQN